MSTFHRFYIFYAQWEIQCESENASEQVSGWVAITVTVIFIVP